MNINAPLFVLTSDTDWASEACIQDVAALAERFRIKPVFFATHQSDTLARLQRDGAADVGVHPNFRPGSTHGADVETVIDHVFRLYPGARSYRCHGFVDSFEIGERMRERGVVHDSNLCLDMQADIRPLHHVSGVLRFPVFWEDNVHWLRNRPWDVDAMLDTFLTPGLKVLNLHPINFALNSPHEAFYRSMRERSGQLTAGDLERLRFDGAGTRTFIVALLERLQALGHRFYTIEQIAEMTAAPADPALSGRQHQVSEAEYEEYWRWTPAQRQDWVRRMYDQHDPADPYATSRDHNLRELEIQAIGSQLPAGEILDLGCGNGYTLLSLARTRPSQKMVGIDFSSKMIDGAKQLHQREAPGSDVTFVCGDAIAHVRGLADRSVDAVITERFLLNLPTPEVQREVIREIHRVLRPGGRFMMCEGSLAGFRELNRLRTAAGLDAIRERSGDNASAIRFEDAEIEAFCAAEGFKLRAKLGFRDYFVMSRVLHPLMVAPQPVRFGARLNDLAREIQSRVELAPGMGSNVVWVFGRSVPA